MRVQPDLSLVIAAYNCTGEIAETLSRLQAYFEKQGYGHEVIVVDDGSSDATAATLHDCTLRYPELKTLGNERNMGKGYAIKKGILQATGRFVFYTDADLAYPIQGIETFLQPLLASHYDVVVGSRIHAASLFYLHPRYFRYVYKRHLMSRFFNWVVRATLGIRAVDTQCGLKGFTAEATKAIFSRVDIRGFAFDVEVLLIAQRLGLRIMEIPVTFAYSGEVSSVKLVKNACQAFRDLITIYRRDRQGRYRACDQDFSQRA